MSGPRPRSSPAAPAQNPLWLLQQLEPESSAYNLAFHLELDGPLDAGALDAAWRKVVERHPVLRARFSPAEAGAEIEALPVEALPLAREAAPADAVRDRILSAARRPFDLAAGPPSRACLWSVGPERHRLAFAFHHAVFDGWSLNLLLIELAAAYDHALGEGPALPALPKTYFEHATRAHAELRAEDWHEALAYWKDHLHGAPAALDLPRARLAPESPRTGSTLRARFAGLADPLAALAARAEATPFMVMLAAYVTLLARYTDARDLVVGTPLATRLRPDVRSMIGLFLNTVALRISLEGNPSFLELVARVKRSAIGGFRHYRVPFERVVEALHPERRAGATPLFSTMFITQNAPVGYRFRGLEHRYHDDDPAHVKFDLTLSTQVLEDDLEVSLEHADDRLDGPTARGMLDAYRVLVASALETPERPALELPCMERAAARVELARWIGPPARSPLTPTLEQIEAHARAAPEKIAARSAGGKRTYRALWAAAERLARGLAGLGVGPGDRVGVRLARDHRLPEALLGVMLSGAAYVPLDPEAPAPRRRAMLEDAKAKLLLVDTPPEAGEAPEGTQVALRDALDAPAAPRGSLPPRPTLESPAYVIYTSGSSGRPKGVHVRHGSLAAFHRAATEALGLGPQDVLLGLATLTFDPSVLELMTPLTFGGACYVLERDVAVDGARLAKAITTSGATVLQTTPTSLKLLLGAGWQPSRRLTVLVGGEGLPRDVAARLLDRVARLYNIYGPTEATVWSAALPVTPALLAEAPDVVPVGGVFPEARYYLLDPSGRPVPPGARGEICISGPQVSDGYLDRPALAAAHFVADPHAPGATMYRTGDEGRGRTDGSIEFLGRSDLQIKIRGFRIEPAEIEAALRRQPGLRDAVVVAVDRGEGKELAAYVVDDGAFGPEAQARLLSALRAELPSHMVPSHVHSVPTIPRTPNGKLDRARLPEVRATPRLRRDVDPSDEVEARLLELWRGLLGRRDVGVEDNFFDVGGHSMLAARLAQRVEHAFGQHLEVSTFFHAQTVAQQARAIRGEGFLPAFTALDPLKTSGTRRPWFYVGASNQARGLAEHLDPDQPMYALKVLGLPDDHSMHVEAVAATFVEQIRAFQPEGPYVIGGFCQDAKLALSVAEQLQRGGAEVARVVYLDVVWLPPEKLRARRKFVENVSDMGPKYAARWLQQRIYGRALLTGEHVYDGAFGALARHTPFEAPLTTRHRDRLRALRRSMAEAPERPFEGDVDIMLCQEWYRPSAERALAHMGTGRVRVFEVPGLHHGLFYPPSVYWLAARVSERLQDAFRSAGAE